MTIKFNDGKGNGGEQFKPTVVKEPIDASKTRQFAQATIDLNTLKAAGGLKDGTTLQIGDTKYTFAIGANSKYQSAANVIDLTDRAEGSADLAEVAANRLSKVAEGNSKFLVGSDTKGIISLTEKDGAIDYSVNNLAGADHEGTDGKGTNAADAGVDGNDVDATLND